MTDPDILEHAHEAVLTLATALVLDHDQKTCPHLLAHAIDWLATQRELETLHRHLLRQADTLLADARAAAWHQLHSGR